MKWFPNFATFCTVNGLTGPFKIIIKNRKKACQIQTCPTFQGAGVQQEAPPDQARGVDDSHQEATIEEGKSHAKLSDTQVSSF